MSWNLRNGEAHLHWGLVSSVETPHFLVISWLLVVPIRPGKTLQQRSISNKSKITGEWYLPLGCFGLDGGKTPGITPSQLIWHLSMVGISPSKISGLHQAQTVTVPQQKEVLRTSRKHAAITSRNEDLTTKNYDKSAIWTWFWHFLTYSNLIKPDSKRLAPSGRFCGKLSDRSQRWQISGVDIELLRYAERHQHTS